MFLAASTANKQQGGKIRASFVNFLIITISLASRNCGFQNTANHLPFQNIAPYTVMNVNYTYCGDHFAIYTYIKLLFCTPETNVSVISQLKKKLSKTQPDYEPFPESSHLLPCPKSPSFTWITAVISTNGLPDSIFAPL